VKKRARLISFILLMAFICQGTYVFAEEKTEKDYIARMVYYSDKDAGEGMTVSNNGLTKVERAGRYGKMTDVKNGGLYYWCNISDDLLYNIPENTPIDITVEYFDESDGFFSLYYDSHNPDSYSYVSQGPWKVADSVRLTNSKTWKTHVFHLEDAKFANTENNCDFRLGSYSNYETPTTSPGNVVISSITVSHNRHLAPVKAEVYTEHNGNIMDVENPVVLKGAYLNIKDSETEFKTTHTAFDTNGNLIKEVFAEGSLAPNERKVLDIPLFDAGAECGIYTLKTTLESWCKDNPDVKGVRQFDTEFSVSHLLEDGEGNIEYGTSQNPIEWNIGDMNVLPDLMVKNGMTWWRDAIPWDTVETSKGQYKIPEDAMEKLKKAKEKGIKILLVCIDYNPFYDEGNTPYSDEGIAAYARYCAFLARELRGIVDAFEIWNEYDIQAFNKTKEPAETYAKMLKAAYTSIKAANPDVIVSGLGVAHIEYTDYDFIKRVFEQGGYDYMDVLSYHPYDWSAEYREYRMIEISNNIKKIMREYGGEKPIWYSEVGFRTVISDDTPVSTPTQELQAAKYPFMLGIINAYNLADLVFQYSLTDRYENKPTELASNWGIIYSELNRYRPNGAKKAYISVSAFNKFVGNNSTYEEMIAEDRVYAFKYRNNNLNKNVVQLVTGKGEKLKTYDFGTNTVAVYDLFGNLVARLHSPDGKFTFTVKEETVYVVGDLTKFEESKQQAHISIDKVIANATLGDTVTYNFTKTLEKDLVISVEDAKGISIEKNQGFKDDKAEVVIKVNEDAVGDPNGDIRFNVTIADKDGKIYSKNEHAIRIVDELSVKISAEQAVKNSKSHWRARVTLKSNSNTKISSGELNILEPDHVAQIAKERKFTNLKPGEEITYLFNIPEKISKNTVSLVVNVKTVAGFEKSYTQLLDFSSAIYTSKKPVIDGVVSLGEWTGSWIAANETKDYVTLSGDWGGPEDLSFTGTAMWDEENFYFTAVVTDDIFSKNFTPKNLSNAWRGDSIQIGIDDTLEKDPEAVGEFSEFTIVKSEVEGDVAYRTNALYGLPYEALMETADICIKNYIGYTIYECAIPWSEIFYDGYTVDTNRRYAFSVLVNDNDGTGRCGYLQYTSGIGNGKDMTKFGSMYFHK